MDLRHVRIDVNPGFYRDVRGDWQRERRLVADRRTDPFESRKYQERRTLIRRNVDRDMLDFLNKQEA